MLGITLYHWSIVYEFEDNLTLSKKCIVDAIWILEEKLHQESDTMIFMAGVKNNWVERYESYYQEMKEVETVIKYKYTNDSMNFQEIYHGDLKNSLDR